MPEKREISLPIFEQAADELKRSGQFRRDLAAPEVAGIMTGIVGSLVSGQGDKKAAVEVGGVEKLVVGIERQTGIVSGDVKVTRPVRAKIPVKFVLGNSGTPGKLQLVGLSIGSGLSRIAVKTIGGVLGVDIEAEARKQLGNPNQALTSALDDQLFARGVEITGASYQFTDKALLVALTGRPITQR